ncbi:MAG: hypothetical protein RSD41_02285 [Kiritimatiellia bacterium]
MTQAHTLFTAIPKRHNCAQAVTAGCGGDTDTIAEMASCGGGRAPGGLCGALHAAINICPDHAEAIKAEFIKTAGALTCREIKSGKQTPCPSCVEIAASLVERFHS